MKKHIRLLTFLMALILVLGAALLTPSPARAVILQTFRVQAGGVSRDFDDFTAAIDWASTYTTSVITLQDDYAYDTAIELAPIGKPNITVDLNGHNLTLTEELYIILPMSLTFTDSATEKGLLSIHSLSLFPGGTGDIINLNLTDIAVEASGYTMIRAMNNTSYKGSSNVSIENATLSGNSILAVGFNSSASIKNSTLTGSGTLLTLENNGSSYPVVAPTAGASATVENSTLSGNSCIIANELCSLTITGSNNVLKSTNNSFSTISSRGATLNITGTTIDAVFRATDLNGGTATFTDCVLNNTCYMKEDAQATFYDSQISDFYLLDDALAICYDGALSDYVYLYRLRPGGLVHWDTTTSTATVYGEVFLSDDLTIQSGQTFNFITGSVPAKLIPGEHTITSYGTILVDGVEHVHSGEETVEKKDSEKHHTNVICTDCPIGYVGYINEESHTVDTATGLCSGCKENVAKFSLTQGGSTTYYTSFKDAVNAITGKATLTLEANGEERNVNYISLPAQEITLDLNGKDFSLHRGYIDVPNGGKLTFLDSTETQAGKLSLFYITVKSGGEMQLESGTLHSNDQSGSSINVHGKLTMTGGNVTHGYTTYGLDIEKDGQGIISGGFVQLLSPALTYDGEYITGLSCNLTLSGGSFGKIDAGFSDDELYGTSGVPVTNLLAPGCKYFDSNGNEITNANYLVEIKDVTVVCCHAGGTADCRNKAICITCGASYGELGDHGTIDSATGNCNICGEFGASISVTHGSTTLYYSGDIRAVLENISNLTDNQRIQVKLLADVVDSSDYNALTFPAKDIALELNGKALTQSGAYAGIAITSGGSLTVTDSSQEKNGKIAVSSNFNVNAGATLRLSGGTITGSPQSHLLIVYGTFIMTGGTVTHESADQTAIYADAYSTVKISGGSVSCLYVAVPYESVPQGVALSGGSFGKVYARTSAAGSYTAYLSETLAPACYFQDALGNKITNIGNSTEGVLTNVTVVCGHTGGTANCQHLAICTSCGASYGELAPNNHDLTITADNAAGTLTQTCLRDCGYEKQIQLTVPTDAVYDGTLHMATSSGEIPGYSAVITYYQNGEELNESPTRPGSYTAKLFLAEAPEYCLSADFSIARATITPYVSAGDGYKKFYDGTTELPANTMMVYPTGEDLIGSADVRLNGTWAFASAEAGTTEITVKITLSGKDAHLYQLSTDTLTGDWGIIEKAPLTIAAEDITAIYGDEPEFSATYSGFVPDEDESILSGELTFESNFDTANPGTRSVGDYSYRPTGLRSSNYDITFVPGALTVTPRPITLTTHSKSVVYGDDAPEYTWNYEGLAYNDTKTEVYNIFFEVTSDYAPGMDAGETFQIKTENLVAVPGNYILAGATLGRLTVTKRTIEATLSGSASKYYDGTNTIPEDHSLILNLSNAVSGDDVSIHADYTYGASSAGENVSVFAKNLTLSGEDAKNYYLYTPILMENIGTIEKAPLNVFADEKRITYGEDAPELTATFEGFVNGEDITDLKGKLVITTDYDVTVPEKRSVADYAIQPGGLESDNYAIRFVPGILTVTPAPLFLWPDSKTVVYGDEAPEYTYRFDGLKFNDTIEDVNASIDLDSEYTPGAGVDRNYSIAPTHFDFSASQNYTLGGYCANLLTVEKRPLTPILFGEASKYYDGTTDIMGDHTDLSVYMVRQIDGGFLEGVLDGDDVTAKIGTSRYASPDASYSLIEVIAEGITLEGEDTENYVLLETSATANIGIIIPLDISGLYAEAKPQLYYNGKEQTQQVSVSKINGLTPTYELGGNTATEVGWYSMTVDGTDNFYGRIDMTFSIDVDTSPLDQITGNINSSHREIIEDVLADLETVEPYILDDPSFAHLKLAKENCENWLKLIDDAQKAANTDAIQAASGITPENVKPEDKEMLENAQKDLESAIENCSSTYTEEELAAIIAAQERIDAALQALERAAKEEAAQAAANTPAISQVQNISDKNVTKDDKAALEQAKKDLETAARDHSEFYTEEEAAKLYNDIQRVDDALQTLEKVEQVEATLAVVPKNPSASNMDDVESVLNAYEALSDHEKALLGEETAKQMEALNKAHTEFQQNITRVYGNTRYQTAINAAYELKAKMGGEPFGAVIVARGDCFADALSAGYLADQKGAPILLVNEKSMDMVKAFIRSNTAKGGTVYILGGTAAIPEHMEAGLDGYTVKRLAGNDRYETNLAILREAGVAGKNMIVCNGGDYPDALSAAALGCPIMLVRSDLTQAQQELLNAGSKQVYIIGGTKAVSARTEKAIAKMGCSVTRVAGADRYETSVQLAHSVFPNAEAVVLVSGKNYPDALCAGPLARQLGAPVILTAPGKEASLESYLSGKQISNAYILGGPQALPYNSADALLGSK